MSWTPYHNSMCIVDVSFIISSTNYNCVYLRFLLLLLCKSYPPAQQILQMCSLHFGSDRGGPCAVVAAPVAEPFALVDCCWSVGGTGGWANAAAGIALLYLFLFILEVVLIIHFYYACYALLILFCYAYRNPQPSKIYKCGCCMAAVSKLPCPGQGHTSPLPRREPRDGGGCAPRRRGTVKGRAGSPGATTRSRCPRSRSRRC